MIAALARPLRELASDHFALRGENELEALAQELLSAQESERARIAADLHDDIGQQLAAIKFSLDDALAGLVGRLNGAERDMLEAIAGRVSEAIEETRRISMGLRPPMLDDLGVTYAIHWFCSELRAIYKHIGLRHDVCAQEDAIPRETKIVVFRILQEACNNACKYSGASELSVRFETDAEGMRLQVADNGVGFDPEDAQQVGLGFGLRSMRERALLTGGQIRIVSRPGAGTRVLAEWPLQTA
jgi:signal transduction histidine kinase